MAINKTDSGWKVDFRIGGRNGKRIIRVFPTKGECERFQRWAMAQHDSGKPWDDSGKQDKRTLSDLINLWFDQHGQYLKDGERRRSKLRLLCDDMQNPIARSMTAKLWNQYRSKRTAAGISPKTLNNELGYLQSLFTKLHKSGDIEYPTPLTHAEPLRIAERELSYLTDSQIDTLLASLQQAENQHVELITLVCLATGARWGEAEGLTRQRVHQGMVTFTDTKNGRNRSVPVPQWLYDRLQSHNPNRSALFSSSIGAFRRALARTDIELPKGQAAHVLRHTFASHFMMNGGSILTLQRILGHADIKMTMRYAHLAPDHLQDATRFNPLSGKSPHSFHTDDKKRA